MGGLMVFIWRGHKKELNEVKTKADNAASKDEITRIHGRIDLIETRSDDKIRDLRQDMNGLGQRLETAFSDRLEPIHRMLTALVNKNGN